MQFLREKLKPFKKVLIISLVLATINQTFSLVNPQIFRILIDKFANNLDQFDKAGFLRGVGYRTAVGIGAAAISRIAKTFQDYYVNLMSQKVGAYIYADSITHAFSLPYRVFEDWQSGSLLDKLQKARDDIQKFLNSMINTVFLQMIGLLIVFTYAFYVNWIIGLSFLVMLPILGITTIMISRRIRQSQQRIVATSADLAGATTENIRNVTVIKSLGLEAQEVQTLNEINEKLIELEIDKLKLIKTLSFTQGTLINLLRSVLQFVMLWLLFEQAISLGEFFSLLFYSFFVFNPLYELPTVATHYQEAKASNETLQAIHDIDIEEQPSDATTLGNINTINFKGVSFGYHKQASVLKNIDLEIDKGKTIALVGPSGSGKSTILKLLCGLYKPDHGSITFNNIETNNLDRKSLKHRFGIVDQETKLFSGTVRENLLFVKPTATDQECMHALQQAQLTDLVETHPDGLDAKIGEGGLKLSGGQKQRLSIARALLRNPNIIIFDEATSSLDSLVEGQITETIKQITLEKPELITVIVAHRLSTVMHADNIYVLERGEIREQGKHQDLIEIKGLYYALRRQQSGEA